MFTGLVIALLPNVLTVSWENEKSAYFLLLDTYSEDYWVSVGTWQAPGKHHRHHSRCSNTGHTHTGQYEEKTHKAFPRGSIRATTVSRTHVLMRCGWMPLLTLSWVSWWIQLHSWFYSQSNQVINQGSLRISSMEITTNQSNWTRLKGRRQGVLVLCHRGPARSQNLFSLSELPPQRRSCYGRC